MLNAFILLILSLLFFTALFFIAYYFSQYFLNYKPSKKNIEKDLKVLKEEMNPMLEKLVPWNEEEMSLLSLNNTETMKKKGGTRTRKGILYSIYQEPLIAYAYRKYSDGKHGLVYARTSKHEYVYRIMPAGTEVYINGHAYGRLINGKELRDPQNKKILASLNDTGDRAIPVLMGSTEVGQLVDFEKAEFVNPRAYEFLQQMADRERLTFLALTLPHIIMSDRSSTK